MSEQQLPISGNLQLQSVNDIAEIEQNLMLKDRWHGEKDLGMKVNYHIGRVTIYFGNIQQLWFKTEAKRYILYLRSQGKAFATLFNHIQNLGCFAKFLEELSVYSFNEIDNEILSAYQKSLSYLAESTRRNRLICVRCFFDIGTFNGWFSVSTYFFSGKTPRVRPKYTEIKYVPDTVLRQLDEHLSQLPEQVQRMVILLRTLGLRASELFQMRSDCLRQRQNGEWEIHFTNWKFNERPDILPIILELVMIFKEQQEYIKTHLGEGYKYLFSRYTKTHKPLAKVMRLNNFNDELNNLAEKCNICDELGRLWHFTSHQFRRTVATKMTNEGVRQFIIQRYLRHDVSDMMQHYASIFPDTLIKEIKELHRQKKIVDVTGVEVNINHAELENDLGLQWLRSKMQPKALAMGFCARPQLLKPCPHANACMSCQHFRLDEDDLPALRKHLERNQKLKVESEKLGYIRQLQGIEQDEIKLISLIQSLESDNERNKTI